MRPTFLFQRAALAPGVRCQCSRLPSGRGTTLDARWPKRLRKDIIIISPPADSPRPAVRKPTVRLLFRHFTVSFFGSCYATAPATAATPCLLRHSRFSRVPFALAASHPLHANCPVDSWRWSRPHHRHHVQIQSINSDADRPASYCLGDPGPRRSMVDRRRAVQPAFSIPRHTSSRAACSMARRQPTHPYPPLPL